MTNRNRSIWPWIIVVTLIPVLYVLSLGPLVYMCGNRLGRGPKWVDDYFAPVRLFRVQLPLAAQTIDWYTDLWDRGP